MVKAKSFRKREISTFRQVLRLSPRKKYVISCRIARIMRKLSPKKNRVIMTIKKKSSISPWETIMEEDI